jgi:hypothetical protein
VDVNETVRVGQRVVENKAGMRLGGFVEGRGGVGGFVLLTMPCLARAQRAYSTL